ncbi:diguanylate phosphodiesterase [Pseudomonas syringae pv. actinidiae ICMP 19073]|nr:diguanylate phosphodiesterase [Pseudomonas syringae pv. actinidiae ICMP 19073]
MGAQHQASITGWECGVHEALTFNELSHSLIRQALSTQNNLLGQGLDFPLSINLEPSQISDSSFINTMIEQIDQGALSR